MATGEYKWTKNAKKGVPRHVLDNGCDRRIFKLLVRQRRGSNDSLLRQYQRNTGTGLQ